MNLLFWGLLFCLLDWKVAIGSMLVEILPDFIGYFLMMKGLESLREESAHFEKARHWSFGMVVWGVTAWATDLLGVNGMDPMGDWAMVLIEEIVGLIIVWMVVAGIRDLERRTHIQLGGDTLKTVWFIVAVISGLYHLLSWMPMLGTVCNVARWIIGICFLAAFFRSKKQYGEET